MRIEVCLVEIQADSRKNLTPPRDLPNSDKNKKIKIKREAFRLRSMEVKERRKSRPCYGSSP